MGCACRWSSLKAVRPLLRLTHMRLTVLETASCCGCKVCNIQLYCLILLLPYWECVPGGNDWNVVRAANGAFVSFSNPNNATTTVPTWSQRYTAFIKTARTCLAASV